MQAANAPFRAMHTGGSLRHIWLKKRPASRKSVMPHSGRILCHDLIPSAVRTGEPRRAYRTRALRMNHGIIFRSRTGLRHCRFIAKNETQPNAPDLNPLDYYDWDALSEAVYRQRREKFASTDELKAAIMAAWEEVSLGTIRKSIDQWKPRLRAVVEADGDPISHIFK